jgi:hypothetical protein
MTALQIQRHYLEEVSRHVGEPFMPSWSEDIVKLWRDMLDELERGVPAVITKLDWAIRYGLLVDSAARAGFDWRRVSFWTEIFDKLGAEARVAGCSLGEKGVMASLIEPRGPIPETFRKATKEIREHGLTWEEGREFLLLRQRLLEIDIRFGQLGDKGLFEVLDQEGRLVHDVPGVDHVTAAMCMPPVSTRAYPRGCFVSRAPGDVRAMTICSWSAIWDRRTRQVLDLSDPLRCEENWRGMTEEEAVGFNVALEETTGATPGA